MTNDELKAKHREEVQAAHAKIKGNLVAWTQNRRMTPLTLDDMSVIKLVLEEAMRTLDQPTTEVTK